MTKRNRNMDPNQEASSGTQSGSGIGERAKEKAEELGRSAKEQAQQLGSKAKEAAQDFTEQIKSGAQSMTEDMQARGSEFVQQQKSQAAAGVSHFSAALRDAAGRLHRENDHNIAGYIDAVADRVDQAARYLEERDPREILDSLRNTARRHPELFLGGMLVGGFALARFLRASDRARRLEDNGGRRYEYDEARDTEIEFATRPDTPDTPAGGTGPMDFSPEAQTPPPNPGTP
jgi:hypothetical protein